MKFIHLSDLHLGKRVNEYSMLEDQAYILEQIASIVEQEQPDGLLIAGDVYDKSVPSAEAVTLLDDFLTLISRKGVQIYLISGNHDSPERIAFGSRLMEKSGVHPVGGYEGAIKQERQFIHASGEVLPIEKVKHVSKESVAHLARHSNLITKEKRDGGMIPDRLYSVEKQSDYAVYENRFLYMLLCLLRDFITVRYERISALSCRYDGALRLRKTVVTNGRTLTYSVDLREERRDDPFLRPCVCHPEKRRCGCRDRSSTGR